MNFEQAIRYVERELIVLREELAVGQSERWPILCSAMCRHWTHCFENIILIEMQRPGSTRVETAAEWNRVARRVHGFASPIFIVDVSVPGSRRFAFGDHWLFDAAKRRPTVAVYDQLQTVGSLPQQDKTPLGSVVQVQRWTDRFAARCGLDVMQDRSSNAWTRPCGAVIADGGRHDAERVVAMLTHLAAYLYRNPYRSPAPGPVPTTGVSATQFAIIERDVVDSVLYVVSTAVGLVEAVPSPVPLSLGDFGVLSLTAFLSVVQQTSAVILKGLQAERAEELPV